jgi:hypothetical protein
VECPSTPAEGQNFHTAHCLSLRMIQSAPH